MASSSGGRANSAVTNRIRNSASSTFSDNQSLLLDLRKGFGLIKDLAVDFEKQNRSDKVKELDDVMVELLNAYENFQNFSMAIQSVGDNYQPKTEPTDFKKVIEEEISKVKAHSPSDPQSHPIRRQFQESIWNVHHAGQAMPGDEQEDIVMMTSTECSLRNINCPLSGKPVIELSDPVRSVECKHIYEKKAIMNYLKSHRGHAQCPVAACPKILEPSKVVCDPLLLIEIEEMRTMSKRNANTEVIEDFTAFDDEEEED